MQIQDLAIKIDRKQGADRALLVGTTGSGKSTAAEVLLQLFFRDYVAAKNTRGAKPRGRIFVVDTKPRWVPEFDAVGNKLPRSYRNFIGGPVVPRSRLIGSMGDWDMATGTGDGIYVVQQPRSTQAGQVQFAVEVMERIFQTQVRKTPTLVVVDEGMDFFGPTGNARYGDVIQRMFRAGREKGLATLFCTQRPKAINIQCVSESNYLMLFQIDFVEDMKRLWEMGLPRNVRPPADPYHFVLYRNRRLISKDAILKLDE